MLHISFINYLKGWIDPFVSITVVNLVFSLPLSPSLVSSVYIIKKKKIKGWINHFYWSLYYNKKIKIKKRESM